MLIAQKTLIYGKATLRHVLEGAQSNRPRNSHFWHANACIPICKLPMSVSSMAGRFFFSAPFRKENMNGRVADVAAAR